MRKSVKKSSCKSYSQMDIGEVKVADDQDFLNLKHLVENEPGWTLEFDKENTKVWTKPAPTTSFKMVKVNAIFHDVDPEVLYDVLHDPEYRKVWDSHMIEQHDIGSLNPNNDLGYYAMTCPSPVSKRDFVLQRSWLDTGQEKFIINHSVYHKSFPPRKDFIRAKSYITGFLVRPSKTQGCNLDYVSQSDPCGKLPSVLVNKLTQKVARKLPWENEFCYYTAKLPTEEWIHAQYIICNELCTQQSTEWKTNEALDAGYVVRPFGPRGSEMGFVSETDPRGKLPPWLVNRATHMVGPKMVATLQTACRGYPEWKKQHNPHWKPWHNPEQMTKPRVKLEDCQPSSADLIGSKEDNAENQNGGDHLIRKK